MITEALATRAAGVLGGVTSVAVAGAAAGTLATRLRAAGVPVASDEDGVVDGAVVSFLGQRVDAAARRELLASVRGRLRPDARLVVLDHNQPRRWVHRLRALPRLWALALGAARARHHTARELAELGFAVEALRLTADEFVQLVVVRP